MIRRLRTARLTSSSTSDPHVGQTVDDPFRVPAEARVAATLERGSGVTSHVSWACGGFLLGAICWHMIGFWSFIDRVLDDVPGQQLTASASAPLDIGATRKSTARLHVSGAADDCVARDPGSALGETVVRPCVRPVVAMQAAGRLAPLLSRVDP